ncbi:hypothetical protein LCGC14_1016460 [marine sediment metagenome]|uniref:Uncharacterized protein n=1 Tax=marine sediment metagenome TaxID=412755 RepID=A0A0F9QGX4_9ZZZZ
MSLIVEKKANKFCAGDTIRTINGHRVLDIIDYRFYQQEDNLVEYKRDEKPLSVQAGASELRELTFTKEIPGIKKCQNRCRFCFIDQLPKGLRNTLYFKDDDWRLSFLTGNFITLTNLETKDLDRIIEQRISPLYVSLHATGSSVREDLMGIKTDNAVENLIRLDKERIITHIQIVLCPGLNDGDALVKTLADIEGLSNIGSVGLVPVGLTRYQKHDLNSFTGSKAQDLISFIEPLQERFLKEKGENWVYLADEFYLRAGAGVPEEAHYHDFEQLENGIGLVRRWLEGFEKPKISKNGSFVIITGKAFEPILEKQLNKGSDKALFDVRGIKNEFFGPKINVTGLLTARDILSQVEPTNTPVLIPDIVLNENRLFLDDMSEEEFLKKLPTAHFMPTDSKEFCCWLQQSFG